MTYSGLVSYRTFGPEYAMFYTLHSEMDLHALANAYTKVDLPWYRPSSFDLPYMIGKSFLGWHDTVLWKVLELSTAVAAALLIFLWTAHLGIAAATLAAVYFLANPVLFEAVFAISSFDFVHVVLVLASVICWQRSLRHSWGWAFASLLLFAASLTAKETSVATPVYLAAVLAIESFRRRTWPSRRNLLLLAPFFVVLGIYWMAHVRRIPTAGYGATSDYRTEANFDRIRENLFKYPLWMARIFGGVKDQSLQAAEYNSTENNLLGIAILGVTLVGLTVSLRRRRWAIAELVAFTAIFSAVPVYSGGFLHHIVLPLAGFSALFGIACAELFRRRTARAAVVGTLAVFTAMNAQSHMQNGPIHDVYRMNYNLLNYPPVPFDRLHNGVPLVFIEGRREFNEWAYGGYGNLTRLVFLNPQIREKIVPAMAQTPPETCAAWMRDPSAVYLTYDDQMRWNDSTQSFRQFCETRLGRLPAGNQAANPSGVGNPLAQSGLSVHGDAH